MVTNFEFGENENPNFIDLFKSDTIDQSGAQEEGLYIKGKDSIYLDAPAIYPSRDTPLLTEAQDFVGAINELFQGGGEGGDWQPPDDWLTVPEPGDWEICFLIQIYDTSLYNLNSFGFTVCDPKTVNTGTGYAAVDWGDGTSNIFNDNYPGQFYHSYNTTGQYVVKVTTSSTSCFLNFVYSQTLLIAKLGAEILINNQSVPDASSAAQVAFKEQKHLHWLSLKCKNGLLPREQGFLNCKALKRVDMSVLPTVIPANTFANCYSLTKFDFSEVREFEKQACMFTGIKKIYAPLCTSVNSYAMQNCYNLQEAVFAENCTFGSDCFGNCNSLYPRPDGSLY